MSEKCRKELRALYRDVAGRIACTRAHSQERDNAPASPENISRELACRFAL